MDTDLSGQVIIYTGMKESTVEIDMAIEVLTPIRRPIKDDTYL
jgi:hypothetical protein